ncbi:ribokinase [Microbacterium marinilacus]|uniref:Ribokinase n=1 Tax=Microbacterium marinilacus TaxID=415209 RepID=A0ABP7BED4_9MICO|nr:ribokinase [Microbacterium marinilacus]MBY0689335.1 ribokinase [Microbacterium marinilacus]
MSAQVLVVGSINADDAVRLARFPGPGETVSARTLTTALGGKGANQAVAAARAGADVRLVGAVGADDGAPLIAALDADGIDTAAVARLDGVPSGRAIVLIDDDAENSIVVVPGANAGIPQETVRTACAALRPGDALLLQHEVPIAVSRLAAELASNAGATVVWNAAPAPTSVDELVGHVDLLLVNEHELAAIADLLGVAAEGTTERIAGVVDATGAGVVCTLGADGAAYRIGDEHGVAPARSVEAVDTTAAGDTFAGYLAALTGLPLADRMRRALDAASLAVTRPGAAPSIPARGEVEGLAARPLDTDPLDTEAPDTEREHP